MLASGRAPHRHQGLPKAAPPTPKQKKDSTNAVFPYVGETGFEAQGKAQARGEALSCEAEGEHSKHLSPQPHFKEDLALRKRAKFRRGGRSGARWMRGALRCSHQEELPAGTRACQGKAAHPQNKKDSLKLSFLMSGRLDSNQRPPTPEAGALTGLRYTPNCHGMKTLNCFSSSRGSGIRTHDPLLPKQVR